MTRFGGVGLMFLGVALACHLSPANAQTDEVPSDRKVRVVLPSPYKQTDIKPASSKAIQPVASTPPRVTKPAIPVAESPNSKAPTPGQPVQASTSTAPAPPQSGSALRKPSKQVNTPSEDRETGEHDLNLASLADLNRLDGGGMIGRAIIAGRPYRSSDELVTRRILSKATYARIKAQVNVRSSVKY
jgi:DNA uptake protein ComE-like DNA-binding protein